MLRNIFPSFYPQESWELHIYFHIAYAWVLSWIPYCLCLWNQKVSYRTDNDTSARKDTVRLHLWEIR